MRLANILVVEDEIVIATDIETSLINLGYAVSAIASSGEQAIEKTGELRPDLVLMDVRLRGQMDGIEAAEYIRIHFNIPVVYLTAYSEQATLQRAKLTDPFGYILKPFEEKELLTTIEIALRRYDLGIAMRHILAEEKELQVLKSCFISIAADEFNHSLSSISDSTRLIENDNKMLADRIKANLEYMYQWLESLRLLAL